jgi:hypothetical protein
MHRSLALLLGLSGCAVHTGPRGTDPGSPDLGEIVAPVDAGTVNTARTSCDGDSRCNQRSFGPGEGGFPLKTDLPVPSGENDEGLARDGNGDLILDTAHSSSYDFLWLANSEDWNRGTITKIDAKAIKEVARYLSVTCSSNPEGGRGQCDGKNGCCARDSYPEWKSRRDGGDPAPRQQVNLIANSPSRTSVDWNGDVWVANRAFSLQSSVTKIANDPTECIDRNENGKLDTSHDVDGNGVIDTDCNRDGIPDDLATVAQRPCQEGKSQEFFGLDDECVLFTTNTGPAWKIGRPLALGPGSKDFGPSDAWAGTFEDGRFYRIDGESGRTVDDAQLGKGCQPYGVAVDSSGFAWSPNLSFGPLCYFNTRQPTQIGIVHDPKDSPMCGYGISLDRDDNIWIGGFASGRVYRYSPYRGNGFFSLDQGAWTVMLAVGDGMGAGGIHRGVAVDLRTPRHYFGWVASDTGWVVRIPASSLPTPVVPNGKDLYVDGTHFAAIRVAGTSTLGVGLDASQNVWGISYDGSIATRILVDDNGEIRPPDLRNSEGVRCPKGDRCQYQDSPDSRPSPYTYSDFTGFGLRNFTRPRGLYSFVVEGCGAGAAGTKWLSLLWSGKTPPNTTLVARARSGATPIPDLTWGPWIDAQTTSPADLSTVLVPNLKKDNWLEVQFELGTSDKDASPSLDGVQLLYDCAHSDG